MYRVKKEFRFHAAHKLYNLPEGHPCSRLHGHTYLVTCYFVAPSLGEDGFVVDYSDLSAIDALIAQLDHRFLNDIFDFSTTVEHLCYWMYQRIDELFPSLIERVRIAESPETWGEYEREK